MFVSKTRCKLLYDNIVYKTISEYYSFFIKIEPGNYKLNRENSLLKIPNGGNKILIPLLMIKKETR